ncbi:MAG: histidine phosphatase family protein, partial [Desulfovibrionaceae bacterium]|nr:histidine phosphatase family protein [Desulfovibrionaceae bacterium]
FDEINAGLCENMCYSEIEATMPEVSKSRHADKFNYCYPGGESYAMVQQRVLRGLRRALFLSGGAPTCIVGHQAINRNILSLFMHTRTEDIPYMFVPQNQYYRIENTPRTRFVERVPYKSGGK